MLTQQADRTSPQTQCSSWTLHLQHDEELYRKLYVASVNAWLKYELINYLNDQDEDTEEPIEA